MQFTLQNFGTIDILRDWPNLLQLPYEGAKLACETFVSRLEIFKLKFKTQKNVD